jgi:mono/diheme cytochrome c family protein
MRRRTVFTALYLLLSVGFARPAFAQSQSANEGAEFYETKVRPILEAHCYACHGGLDGKKVKGGFNLSSRDGLIKGGENGTAISVGNPSDGALLKAINYRELEMPPKGKLPQAQIDIITAWVKLGVPWSDRPAAVHRPGSPPVDDHARSFWSFQKVHRPDVPTDHDTAWVRNPIDAFIAAGLDAASLKPAAPASRTSLLRRVYYDLTGLPPSVDDVKAFLADDSPEAYEKVVDRLLASPQYGERWARHWLDLVRYGETNSFEVDAAKPEVWRYRDYVIRAFNDDKPYDQFIREQLAGDELEPITADGIIATGYYRLGPSDGGAPDKLQATFDDLDDILATTGQVFLGLTVNCARCHDHKIDPFPTKDYYRLLAFFRGIDHGGRRSLRPIDLPADKNLTAGQVADYLKQTAAITEEIAGIEEALEGKLKAGERDDFAVETNRPSIVRAHFPADISDQTLARYEVLLHERNVLRNNQPSTVAKALCVTEAGANPPVTHILQRGNPRSEGPEVTPGFPSVVTTAEPEISAAAAGAQTSGRRKVLANWIASADNPLTARVMVNRLWHYHFGRGLVRTVSDFGYGGKPATHPELLDWLASEFVDGGWRLKRLHKLIVMSSTYRMSSLPNEAALAKDPENDLMWRYDLQRLEAEELRDSVLAVCGNLNLKMGGPSVYPKIPAVVFAGQSRPGDGWHESPPEEANRRSVYVHVKRSLALPMLAVFDSADTDASCPARFATTQPTQALAMLNSEFLNEQAKIFANDVRKQVGEEVADQIRVALRRVMQREPTDVEVNRGLELMGKLRTAHGQSSEAALKNFCLMALNLNEFMYLD